MNSSKTPRVPKVIRERARSVLRHYPGDYAIEAAAEAAPEHFDNIFQKQRKKLIKGLMNE